MKHSIRVFTFILALLTALTVFACGTPSTVAPTAEPVVVEATVAATAVPTEIPVIEEAITAVTPVPATPAPTPNPTPTPEPTDTPAPTEIPFSYYAPTVNMSFEELVGSLDDFNEADPNNESTFRLPAGYPSPDKYYIIVDLYWQVVMVYSKNPATGEYDVPVRYMICSTGDGRKYHETRVGKFPMEKTKVRFGKFASSPESAQYWSLIVSKTYFHSTLYDKRRDLTSIQKASYEALGSKASHGCIRLTVPDARWIYYNICYGTICEIRKGRQDDQDTAAIKEQLKIAAWKDNALISVGTTPYTDNWTIDEIELDPNYPYIHATQPPVSKS